MSHWFIFWIFFLAATLHIFGMTHELAHREICREFFGNATTSGYYLDGQFLAQATTCYLPKMTEARRNAYDIVDSSGEWTYVYQAIIVAMFFCTFLLKIRDE